jgi:hypothetical protein
VRAGLGLGLVAPASAARCGPDSVPDLDLGAELPRPAPGAISPFCARYRPIVPIDTPCLAIEIVSYLWLDSLLWLDIHLGKIPKYS